MMRISNAALLALLGTISIVNGASPVAYTTILVIVLVELIVSFLIGVICVVFSFSLLLALKDSSSETLPSGDLPPSRRSLSPFIQNNNPGSPGEYHNPMHDSEGDEENIDGGFRRQSVAESEYDYERHLSNADQLPPQGNFVGVMRTFGSYLKFW